MIPKKIWLLLNDDENLVGVSFSDIPTIPGIRHMIRYDMAQGREQTHLPQLELFNPWAPRNDH